ncbi:MAG TPA: hypothetical protein VI299_18755, partial [Polyangiales bacterium]
MRKLSAPEAGPHDLTKNTCSDHVWNDPFEATPDLDAHPAFLGSDQEQQAVIDTGSPKLPVL